MFFHSPKSLDGMVLTVTGEEVYARLGEITVDDCVIAALPIYVEALCRSHEIQSARRNADSSITVTVCDKNCNIEYVFDGERQIPIKIEVGAQGSAFLINVTEFNSEIQ